MTLFLQAQCVRLTARRNPRVRAPVAVSQALLRSCIAHGVIMAKEQGGSDDRAR